MNRTENKYYTKFCDNKKKSATGIGPVCSRSSLPSSVWFSLKSQLTPQFLSGSHSSVFPHSSSFSSTFKRKVITYKVAKSVSFKPNEPRSLTVFHIRITKQKIKKSSNGRIGQHQVIEINGQTQLNNKKDKQEKGKSTKDSTQRRT